MKPHIRKVNGRWGYRSLPGSTTKYFVRLAAYWCKMQNRKEGNL